MLVPRGTGFGGAVSPRATRDTRTGLEAQDINLWVADLRQPAFCRKDAHLQRALQEKPQGLPANMQGPFIDTACSMELLQPQVWSSIRKQARTQR